MYHVRPQRLADNLERVVVGKIKVRVDCGSDVKAYLIADQGFTGALQAGYYCGGLCGSGYLYVALPLWCYVIVVRTGSWVS